MLFTGAVDQSQSASPLHHEEASADTHSASVADADADADADAGLQSVTDAPVQSQSDTHPNAQTQAPVETTTSQQQQHQQQQQQQQQPNEVTSGVIDRIGHNTDYANAQVLKLCAIESWPWQTGSSKHVKQFFQVIQLQHNH